MYRIAQILNNNVAIVHNQDKKQKIVMGRGVAFNKHKGDIIQEKKVERVFEVRDKNTVPDLTTLLASIPLDFVTISYELIDKVQKKYHFAVEAYVYVTLTTHLFGAYQRLEKHIETENYLPDLSDSYQVAYEIADDIIQGFKEKLDISFPETERKSIALHFINAHTNDKIEYHSPLYSNEQVVDIVKSELERKGITRKEENNSDYDRLLIHLKYFVDRINNHEVDSLEVSPNMIKEITKQYPEGWDVTTHIGQLLEEKLNIKLTTTERTYLTIHIQRLI